MHPTTSELESTLVTCNLEGAVCLLLFSNSQESFDAFLRVVSTKNYLGWRHQLSPYTSRNPPTLLVKVEHCSRQACSGFVIVLPRRVTPTSPGAWCCTLQSS